MQRHAASFWDFAKRHKWKLVGAGVIVGGLYYGRKFYLQAKELHDLLNDENLQRDFLEQLTKAADAEGRGGGSLTGLPDPDSAEWKMTLHFQRNQLVSDATVRRNLEAVKDLLFSMYDVDEYTAILRDNTNALTADQKDVYFGRVKIMCFARFLASLYILLSLLWLHRIEINIIGRQMFEEFDPKMGDNGIHPAVETENGEGEGEQRGGRLSRDGEYDANNSGGKMDASQTRQRHEQNYSFLTSTRWLQSQQGLQQITPVVGEVLEEMVGPIQPQKQVTIDELEGLITDVCTRLDKELIANGKAVQFILPESIQAKPTKQAEQEAADTAQDAATLDSSVQTVLDCSRLEEPDHEVVSAFLAETRDYLESPQFALCFQISREAAIRRLLNFLRDKFTRVGIFGPPESAPFPFARCFGRLCTLSEMVLGGGGKDDSGSNDFILDFAQNHAVIEFCEAVYFPQHVKGFARPSELRNAQESDSANVGGAHAIQQILQRLNYHVE